MSPQTGRIYDRTRFGGNPVSGISLDIREESIYVLLERDVFPRLDDRPS
jgi:hypothetical protein